MLKNNQIIPVLFAAVMIMFTGCSKSDDENVAPKKKKKAETATPKTAAEIKAETIAEFEEIIGDGVGNTEFEEAVYMDKKVSEMTENDWDKVVYTTAEDKVSHPFFKFKNGTYHESDAESRNSKGSVFTLTKEDGVFTLIAKREDEKIIAYDATDATVKDDEECFLKVSYDTEKKEITIIRELYSDVGGVMTYAGALLMDRFTALPLASIPRASRNPVSLKASRNSGGSSQSIVARQSSSNSSAATFTGVHQVDVKLEGKSPIARIAERVLKPHGKHYVKFTTNATQVPACSFVMRTAI